MAKEKEAKKGPPAKAEIMANLRCVACGQALEKSGERATCRTSGCENSGRYFKLPVLELEEADDQSARV